MYCVDPRRQEVKWVSREELKPDDKIILKDVESSVQGFIVGSSLMSLRFSRTVGENDVVWTPPVRRRDMGCVVIRSIDTSNSSV